MVLSPVNNGWLVLQCNVWWAFPVEVGNWPVLFFARVSIRVVRVTAWPPLVSVGAANVAPGKTFLSVKCFSNDLPAKKRWFVSNMCHQLVIADPTCIPGIIVAFGVSAVVTRSTAVIPISIVNRAGPDADFRVHRADCASPTGLSVDCKMRPRFCHSSIRWEPHLANMRTSSI